MRLTSPMIAGIVASLWLTGCSGASGGGSGFDSFGTGSGSVAPGAGSTGSSGGSTGGGTSGSGSSGSSSGSSGEPVTNPEPSSLLLLGSGLAGLAFVRRRRYL